jgi:hypothetical protein
MALRFATMPGVFRPMSGSIERASAAIRAAVILGIALTAGCGVPSVTNVTPERIVTGEFSFAYTSPNRLPQNAISRRKIETFPQTTSAQMISVQAK